MTFSAIISLTFAFGISGLCFWAAWSDGRRYLIPNRISAVLVLLWFIYILLVPAASSALQADMHILTSLGVFAVGFLLFAGGWFGGGDVKFLAALSLWAGPAYLMGFLFLVALSGGILSLIQLVRTALPAGQGTASTIRVPYGIAIATGGLYLSGLVLNGMI